MYGDKIRIHQNVFTIDLDKFFSLIYRLIEIFLHMIYHLVKVDTTFFAKGQKTHALFIGYASLYAVMSSKGPPTDKRKSIVYHCFKAHPYKKEMVR